MHPAEKLLLRYGHCLIKWLMRAFLNITVKGTKNTPKTSEGLLVVANHSSYLDVLVVGYSLYQHLLNIKWVISKSNYRLWYLKGLYFLFKVIVVNGTVEKVEKELRSSTWVAIFPEGNKRWCPPGHSRRKTPAVGTAVMALITGVEILPIGLTGVNRVMPIRSFRLRPRRKITVNIGKSFSFPAVSDKKIDDSLIKETTDAIMRQIRLTIDRSAKP